MRREPRVVVGDGSARLPTGIAAGDFNGDGVSDVAVAVSSLDVIEVLLGDGSGGLSAAVSYDVGDGPVAVAVANLDGDGTLDLAVANVAGQTVSILLGDGRGAFSATEVLDVSAVAVGPVDIAAADFDGDGVDDLVTAGTDTMVFLSDP